MDSSAEPQSNPEKSIGFYETIKIPGVLILSYAYFHIKFSLMSYYLQLPNYLQDQNGPLALDEANASNVFTIFSFGGFLGCIIMGLITDLFPFRSPGFVIGTLGATALSFTLIFLNTETLLSIDLIMSSMGLFLNGLTVVVAAIVADIGKQLSIFNNRKSLATVSGIIEGLGGLGGVLGQILIGILRRYN